MATAKRFSSAREAFLLEQLAEPFDPDLIDWRVGLPFKGLHWVKLVSFGRNETVERHSMRLNCNGFGSSPPVSGPKGRRFKSSLPDQTF
ncbi:MAG: hypothetical protein ACYCOR_17340 [Acidobacteriaceae bacterium]